MNKDSSQQAAIPSSDSPECEILFESMEDGVCVQTPDSRIVRANRAFAEMLGLSLDQIIGRNCADVFGCANETEAIPRRCARIANLSQDSVASEEIIGRQPGQRLRSRVSPVRDSDGKVTAFVMVVRDVTDVVAHERRLARVEQLARLGELAAGLAHEIKNPLAGIQGVVDILIQRRSPEDAEREALEGVKREVGRIDATIHMLLDRARPRAANFQQACLAETVLRAVKLARASLSAHPNKQVKIEFTSQHTSLKMSFDPAQIEDAVLNLLFNAIEAIDSHGEIRVSLHEHSGSGDEIVVEVADSGKGIAPENLQRVFSPFFTTSDHGTGLGLPAVRRVAHAHNGRVEVASAPGAGSTFSIHLPRTIGQQ
ncbi:MAG: two-component system sensor histidine kinase NtrB [Blastocatellia bacterium]